MSSATRTEVSARMALGDLLVMAPSEVPKKVEPSTSALILSSDKVRRSERAALGLKSRSADEGGEEAMDGI